MNVLKQYIETEVQIACCTHLWWIIVDIEYIQSDGCQARPHRNSVVTSFDRQPVDGRYFTVEQSTGTQRQLTGRLVHSKHGIGDVIMREQMIRHVTVISDVVITRPKEPKKER